jgi:hypothetical protein
MTLAKTPLPKCCTVHHDCLLPRRAIDNVTAAVTQYRLCQWTFDDERAAARAAAMAGRRDDDRGARPTTPCPSGRAGTLVPSTHYFTLQTTVRLHRLHHRSHPRSARAPLPSALYPSRGTRALPALFSSPTLVALPCPVPPPTSSEDPLSLGTQTQTPPSRRSRASDFRLEGGIVPARPIKRPQPSPAAESSPAASKGRRNLCSFARPVELH